MPTFRDIFAAMDSFRVLARNALVREGMVGDKKTDDQRDVWHRVSK